MVHDFKKNPELTNEQMEIYYFDSPHKQIMESFTAEVVRVIDGDTFKVMWSERDFAFPVRMLRINAPELSDPKGSEAKEYLENRILGKTVDIDIDLNNRVGKFGRILGEVLLEGINLNDEMVQMGHAMELAHTQSGLPNLDKLVPAALPEAS